MDVNDTPQEQSTLIAAKRKVPVIFSGQAGQFFGIWIVNILLSIVTLGIYSAWAKVRTQQYFYGNTKVDGHVFSYLATPMQILKGRILAVILFACYSLAINFYPLVGLGFIAVMIFLFPWLINQGLRFNCRMSSYRNVRFSFKGNYGEAFLYFILLPIVSIFTLYLAMPWALKKADAYVYNNISYGDKPLKAELDTGEYYMAALVIFGLTILFGIIIAIIIGILAVAESMVFMQIVVMVLYFVVFSVISAVWKSRIRNHVVNNCELEGITTFKSSMQVTSYASLILTNMLGIVFSLGLAYPWAKIRTAAYMASVTELHVEEGADSAIDTMEEQQSSFAEEAGELFDVDIALT